MNVRTLSTSHIDDTRAAVSDIMSQLEGFPVPQNSTFGILACHYEFINSGAAEAIIFASPFPVCGASTSLSGTNNADGELILTLTVVSGEEIRKTEIVKVEAPALGDLDKTIAELFSDKSENAANAKSAETAALVWAFAPDFMTASGDLLCAAYNKTGYPAPLFGGYAVDDSPVFNEQCCVFSPDGYSDSDIVFLKIYGDIKPLFGVCSIPESKILPKEGVITGVVHCGVTTVDNAPASEFLEHFGIAKHLETSGAISALSIIADDQDKDQFYSRTLLGVNNDGSAVTGGDLRCGARIRIGLFDREGMLAAAGDKLCDVVSSLQKANILFVYCCATRSVALGSQALDEILLTRETVGDIPFMLAYAGGEIAPTHYENAFFHNQSFCVCGF